MSISDIILSIEENGVSLIGGGEHLSWQELQAKLCDMEDEEADPLFAMWTHMGHQNAAK